MDIRTALFAWREQHRLDARATARLEQLAGLRGEPASLARRLPAGVMVLGVALLGLGVILWIAANWDTLPRAGRFGLLQALVVVALVGAAARPALRSPLALLALREGAIDSATPAFGLLVLASPDPERFKDSMGTEFLVHMAEVASAALSRLR